MLAPLVTSVTLKHYIPTYVYMFLLCFQTEVIRNTWTKRTIMRSNLMTGNLYFIGFHIGHFQTLLKVV